MSGLLRVAAGLSLGLAVWRFVLRRGAGAGAWPRPPALAAALDVTPILVGFLAAFAATARPLLAGLAIAALAGGLSLADQVKRLVLKEPVVFADRAELFEVVRHPGLYLPFAGPAYALAGAGVAIAAVVAGIAWLEPPLWQRSAAASAVEAVAAGLVAYGGLHVTSAWPGLVGRVAAAYRARLAPTRDPALDGAALGPLTCLVVHATLAAAERPARRAAAIAAGPALPAAAGPIVMVQAESFMDPRRLHADLAGLMPHWEAAAWQRGRLDVPAWGANTVRTEFAVLSGVAEAALGLDGFNPYEAFVDRHTALPSLPRAARAAGYRTVFVHPFDLAFYGRSRVLPWLGFDELVGPAAFADAPRRGLYVADEAIAPVVAGLLQRPQPTLVFVATMEAHGPWPEKAPRDGTVKLPPGLAGGPDKGQLAQWLWHLQGTDQLFGRLRELVGSGWLVAYGDHQPSLPDGFAALGLADRRTDYAIWGPRPAGVARDIAAWQLGATLAGAMQLAS